jgi:hypothetical protein
MKNKKLYTTIKIIFSSFMLFSAIGELTLNETVVKEWAYAGFTFDFIGAIIGFIATGNLVMPDVIMAPVGLMLCLSTYFFWKKTNGSYST